MKGLECNKVIYVIPFGLMRKLVLEIGVVPSVCLKYSNWEITELPLPGLTSS